MNRFELDRTARSSADGKVLIAGSPLSMFRLSEGGRRIVERIRSGEPLPDGHAALTARLVDAGALHPVFEPGTGPTAADVTLVVPAFRADPDRVRKLIANSRCARAIVVDDASPVPFPALDGADIVRLERNGGPGRARQAGLDRVSTPYVAFLDTDLDVTTGWLDGLLPCFVDPTIALVAPRVCAAGPPAAAGAVPRTLARFESLRGPLDLGPERGRIRPSTRVSYVPAAALVCRTEALRTVGGFDPTLRLGEDVDLVWRLDRAGWRCRYEPASAVQHSVRPSLRAWLGQRAGYGFSATDLAMRHPGSVAPVQTSVWSVVSWGLPAAGFPIAGLLVAGGSAAALVRKLPEMPDRTAQALRLAGLGHLHAGRTIATALTRSWWPVSLAASLVLRRARRVLLAAAVVPGLIEWWKCRREMDPARFVLLRLLDDGAYGLGLWRGAFARRSAAALVPRLTNLPKWFARPRSGAGARTPSPAGATVAGGTPQ